MAAGLFLILWSGLLVIGFTRRLRRGMKSKVEKLVTQMVDNKLESGLFPNLERSLLNTRRWTKDAEKLQTEIEIIRDEIATVSHLGAKNDSP